MNTVNDNYDKLLKVADVMVQDEVTNEEIENVAETIQELHEEEPMEDYIPTEEDLELEKEPQKLNVLIDSTGKINNVLANDIKYSSDKMSSLVIMLSSIAHFLLAFNFPFQLFHNFLFQSGNI